MRSRDLLDKLLPTILLAMIGPNIFTLHHKISDQQGSTILEPGYLADEKLKGLRSSGLRRLMANGNSILEAESYNTCSARTCLTAKLIYSIDDIVQGVTRANTLRSAHCAHNLILPHRHHAQATKDYPKKREAEAGASHPALRKHYRLLG